jgi:hypothetical protein
VNIVILDNDIAKLFRSIVTKQLEMQAYFKHILKSKQENWYNPIDQTLNSYIPSCKVARRERLLI